MWCLRIASDHHIATVDSQTPQSLVIRKHHIVTGDLQTPHRHL
jgi:hypothetical protein